MPAGYDAFSTLHPSAMLPSVDKSAAPTRNPEYGAYARSMAANARSRSMVMVRSSPVGSTPGRVSTAMLTGDRLREERRAPAAKGDPEPFRDRRAQVRECGSSTKIDGPDTWSEDQQRHALARVVGR